MTNFSLLLEFLFRNKQFFFSFRRYLIPSKPDPKIQTNGLARNAPKVTTNLITKTTSISDLFISFFEEVFLFVFRLTVPLQVFLLPPFLRQKLRAKRNRLYEEDKRTSLWVRKPLLSTQLFYKERNRLNISVESSRRNFGPISASLGEEEEGKKVHYTHSNLCREI